MLQRFDSPHRFSQGPGYLLVTLPFHEPKEDDQPLILSEVRESLSQFLLRRCAVSCLLHILTAAHEALIQGQDHASSRASLIVNDDVSSNCVEPTQQGAAPVDETVYALHHPYEHRTGEILRRGSITHPVVDVAVDSRLMALVDFGEGVGVTLLRPLD